MAPLIRSYFMITVPSATLSVPLSSFASHSFHSLMKSVPGCLLQICRRPGAESSEFLMSMT